jgi:hypothetical protein
MILTYVIQLSFCLYHEFCVNNLGKIRFPLSFVVIKAEVTLSFKRDCPQLSYLQ